MAKYFYERKLPHYQPPGVTFFVTYRLEGSIPMEKIREMQADYKRLEQQLAGHSLSGKALFEAKTSLQEACFEQTDHYLDKNLNEPYWLKEDRIASLIADSLHFLAQSKIELWCFCIMSNHVHVLLDVKKEEDELFRIMQQHKSFTAAKANKILQRTGQFWETESYDHIVREGRFEKIVMYILNNPVNAGLVKHWTEWKWTYLHPSLRDSFLL
ncbi:MAG: transposase [Chitinophagaceae bacterium]|nr:transposase [Chitinophagaceae bacterium]